jgi:NADPH:quinone reductase-like Zn-dependent oxidoreductase
MKALLQIGHGSAEAALRLVDLPDPKPGPGEIVVAVEAAPIHGSELANLADPRRLPSSELPKPCGLEGVGRVATVGPGVKRFKTGDRVLCPKYLGTFRELLLCKADEAYAAPDEGDAAQFAILSTMGQTAELLLEDFVPLAPGEWLLQNGGSSSIAGLIMGLAKARGWKTVNLVRRPGLEDKIKALGGDAVVVDPGKAEDLAAAVATATGNAPIRIALDMIGGDLPARMMRCLAPGGALVIYGRSSGQFAQIDHTLLARRDLAVRGMGMSTSWGKRSPEQQRALMEELATKAGRGLVKTDIAESFALKDYLAAYKLAAEENAVRNGKVILRPLHG